MSKSGTYGSDVECRAASEFLKVNIIIYRVNADGSYFKYDFPFSPHADSVYLLLTGMRRDNDLDDHFQLLKPVRREEKGIISNGVNSVEEAVAPCEALNTSTESQLIIENNNFSEPMNQAIIAETEINIVKDSPMHASECQNLRDRNEEFIAASEESESESSEPPRKRRKLSLEKSRQEFDLRYKKAILSTYNLLEEHRKNGSLISTNTPTELTAHCFEISDRSVRRVIAEKKSTVSSLNHGKEAVALAYLVMNFSLASYVEKF